MIHTLPRTSLLAAYTTLFLSHRRGDNSELVRADLVQREERLVLPGDQHVADATLGEGGRGAARTGVEHRDDIVYRAEIGRAHVCTPVSLYYRFMSSVCTKHSA